MRIICLILILFLTSNVLAYNNAVGKPKNYYEAKKVAIKLFLGKHNTLYCGCGFDRTKHINKESCPIVPVISNPRANRLEFEHILPMAHARQHFLCWQKKICVNRVGERYKGRKCCQKVDSSFIELEAELFNLWPVVGSINQARSNYKYTEFTSNQKRSLPNFSNCPIVIDFKKELVEPRDEIKGLVARASLFTSNKYNISLSKRQRNLFIVWNNKFPPNQGEREWEQEVREIQGYGNPYISNWRQLAIN